MVLIGIKRQNDECTPPLQTVLYNIMTMCMSVITAKGVGEGCDMAQKGTIYQFLKVK